MTSFLDFGLSDNLLLALKDLEFKAPTPIQHRVIPALIDQKNDLIGLAHTGTGKTAAFSIPLIENIDRSYAFIQGLILTPTRELAKQIETQIKALSKHHKGLKISVVYGGVSINTQIKDLKRPPHILIATPGRLLDLTKRKIIRLNDVRTIVLDEADEMLRMGFIEDINWIISSIKGDFNTWLFSATFPKEIRNISKKYMVNPIEYAVDAVNSTNKMIRHEYVLVKGKRKSEILMRLIDSDQTMRGIVFCRTKRGTQIVADELKDMGYSVEAMHGDLSQTQREMVMNRLRRSNIRMIIATDVASRGIDVFDLSHIVHFDMPDDAVNYTHRSGRTARAGKEGISMVFVPPSAERKLRHIEKQLKIHFHRADIPSEREVTYLRLKNWANEIVGNDAKLQIDPEFYAELFQILSVLSKEELIERIIADWASKQKHPGVLKPFNESKRNKDQRRSDKKGPKPKKQSIDRNAALYNFYVNLGYIDGIGKDQLLEILSGSTGINISYFKNIEIHQKHTLFDAPADMEGKIIHRMKGLKYRKRKLRVNRNHK